MMYQATITEESTQVVTETFWKSVDRPSCDIAVKAEKLFADTLAREKEHEALIIRFLTDKWPYERMGEMEKCILKVALEELLYSSTPAYAVLDEYVTLTRRFTDVGTASFVNGLLENVRNTFKQEALSE